MIDKREEIARYLHSVNPEKSHIFWEALGGFIQGVFLDQADQILKILVADDQTVELLSPEEIGRILSRWNDADSEAMAYGNDRPDISDALEAASQSTASKMVKGDGKTKWMKIAI